MKVYLQGAALLSGLLLAQNAMATVSVTAVQSSASTGSLTVEAPNAQTLPTFEAAGAGLGGYSDSETIFPTRTSERTIRGSSAARLVNGPGPQLVQSNM